MDHNRSTHRSFQYKKNALFEKIYIYKSIIILFVKYIFVSVFFSI